MRTGNNALGIYSSRARTQLQLRFARTRDEMRTRKNGFGHIGNEVDLVQNLFKLTTDGLGLPGKVVRMR